MIYSVKHTNKISFYLALCGFLTAWVISFYGFRKHQDIDSTTIFIVLLLTSITIWNIKKNSFFRIISKYSFVVLIFFCFVTTNSLLNGIPIYEILVATKPLILFILIFYSVSKVAIPRLPQNFAIQVLKITSALMFVKYSISHLLSLNDRPFLFTENNFELVIPLGLLFCYRNKSSGLTILLILVILMSGSKSAIGSLILLPIISFAYSHSFLVKFVFASLLFFATASLIKFGIFDEVDRFVYFTNIYTFYDFSAVNLLFGDFQISPLFNKTCEAFNYMGTEKVIQEGGKYVCYSRVANFTSIRLFIDFGIFFGTCFYYFWFVNLKKLFPKKIAVNLFFIGFLNGLSVSGFGNAFYLIMLLLIFSSSESKCVYPKVLSKL